jgi:hypothetical protein
MEHRPDWDATEILERDWKRRILEAMWIQRIQKIPQSGGTLRRNFGPIRTAG